MKTKNKTNNYIMPTYGRFDVQLKEGSGATATDESGKEYIDFTSGIGVNTFGFSDKEWANAVSEQLCSLQHSSNLYYTAPSANLAEKLCTATGYAKAFFANSGAEANECAIKLARKAFYDKTGRSGNIITMKGSFHGRTLATLTATGQDKLHPDAFAPYPAGFIYADSLAHAESLIDENTAAVMLEFVKGEGGVLPLDKGEVQSLAKTGVTIIADEVQSGTGRTGKFLAAEHYGIKPQITTLAKGLGGGLPIGVCLAVDELADTLSAGFHGATFGANPAVCAGADNVLGRILADGFLKSVEEKGEYIRTKLSAMPKVKSVRGLGLMIGIDTTESAAREIAEKCAENGLLVLTANTSVRFLPPLNIGYDEIDKGLKIFESVI